MKHIRIFPFALLLAFAACAAEDTATPAARTHGTIVVQPAAAELGFGETVAFRARVTGPTDPGTEWSVREGAAGGVVQANGIYTAPAVAGEYHLDVRSRAHPELVTTVAVVVRGRLAHPWVVNPLPGEGVQLEPRVAIAGQASAPLTDPVWRVLDGDAGGSITPGGVYTAPAHAGSFRIEVGSASHSVFPTILTASVPPEPVWARSFGVKQLNAVALLPDARTATIAGTRTGFWDTRAELETAFVFKEFFYGAYAQALTSDGFVIASRSLGTRVTAFHSGGGVQWSTDLPLRVHGLKVQSGDEVFFTSEDGRYGLLDARGELLWVKDVAQARMLAGGGRDDEGFTLFDAKGTLRVHRLAPDGSPRSRVEYVPPREFVIDDFEVHPLGDTYAVRYIDLYGLTVPGLLRFGFDGSFQSGFTLEHDGAPLEGWITGVSQAPDGDLLLTGTARVRDILGEYAPWFARLDPEGHVRWAHRFHIPGDSLPWLGGGAVTPSGMLLLWGTQNGAAWMARVPADGWLGLPENAPLALRRFDLTTRDAEWSAQTLTAVTPTDASLDAVTNATVTVSSAGFPYTRLTP